MIFLSFIQHSGQSDYFPGWELVASLNRILTKEDVNVGITAYAIQMKILLRNLARQTTEAELLVLFQEYGTVQYCKLVMDRKTGLSKGFGFVEMPKAGAAKAAIKGLNSREVGGNTIRVKKAEAPATKIDPTPE